MSSRTHFQTLTVTHRDYGTGRLPVLAFCPTDGTITRTKSLYSPASLSWLLRSISSSYAVSSDATMSGWFADTLRTYQHAPFLLRIQLRMRRWQQKPETATDIRRLSARHPGELYIGPTRLSRRCEASCLCYWSSMRTYLFCEYLFIFLPTT